MAKKYELWLDESGQFVDDKAKKEKENPSLIGGILLEKDMADVIKLDDLIPEERRHATELNSEDKQKYLIPTLQRVKDMYNAKLFYIENPNYEYEKSNRQLYLRMMAEGLLQLMQTLNAQTESVELEVIIAQRQDWQAASANRRIPEKEYIYNLHECIKKKKKQKRIALHKDSRLSFQLDSAYRNVKLELADYACYTRFRRKSKVFCNQKKELSQLFDDAYLFTVSEMGSLSYINCLLSNGMVADAIYELFTTVDAIDVQKEVALICDRMCSSGYRLVKSQLKQFTADIISYTAGEEDYEIGERLLKKINDELFPALRERQLPYEFCQFHILIQLVDMYLREGDIIAARKAFDVCKKVQIELGNSLEEVFSYYQLVEKEAVLLIDEFRFKQAYELMDGICGIFQPIMECIKKSPCMSERFSSMRSEYFGDALCMKIYAGLFLQRKNPSIYEALCRDSDLALCQYPNFEGELERHRQYRSHIELEAGHYEQALLWLMRAKMYRVSTVSRIDVRDFLSEVNNSEYVSSCQYYIMYYLLIMAEAKAANNSIADMMFEVLNEQEELISKTGLSEISHDEKKFTTVDVHMAMSKSTGINYHPLEILYWKYASFLHCDKKLEQALCYYKKAEKLCFRYQNYTTMKITGIGIMAEEVCCYIDQNDTEAAKQQYQKIMIEIARLETEELQTDSLEFVLQLKTQAKLGGESSLNRDLLYELSRMITY